MGKTAIIIGSTGLTGNIVLKKLLNDERYSTLKIFSRKNTNIKNTKIIEKIGSLLNLQKFEDDFYADELYCCIGTTAKKTPDKEVYKKIDYGIPVMAAKICKEHRIDTILVISSLGANVESKVFYSKTKGEMERDVIAQGIPNTYLLRPSIILGQRNENRIGESVGKVVLNIFRFLMVGKLKKYRPVEADCIAERMIHLANSRPLSSIISSDKI